jgi:endoglucanase Acf2
LFTISSKKVPRIKKKSLLLFVAGSFLIALWTFDSEGGALERLGSGSFTLKLSSKNQPPKISPYKTENVRQRIPTNRWWSSLVSTKFSENHYPHPLAVQATRSGLRVYYPGPSIHANQIGIFGSMPGVNSEDLTLGNADQEIFVDARIHDFSDWFVTAKFSAGKNSFHTSYGLGSPFVYATYEHGRPVVTFSQKPEIWFGEESSPVLGITINGRHYGLFASSNSTWSGLNGRVWINETKSKNYFSLAVLPDRSLETLKLFRRHAYTHVSHTQVNWKYDSSTNKITTQFSFKTKVYEGKETRPLIALYPHQWAQTKLDLLPFTYNSVRGIMKLAVTNFFTTEMIFPGILPALPILNSVEEKRLVAYLAEESRKKKVSLGDTYWAGKRLGKLASLAGIASQVKGEYEGHFEEQLKNHLEEWFRADDNRGGLFYYDNTWGTLIGYPASYGSDTELNDHHFHYGYMIRAAAELAQRDPEWAKQDQWGSMVELLIKDIVNTDRKDERFPFLRCFDPYAGHSWASGHGKFADGNNLESSSEAMNAWSSLILWGEVTGNQEIRDLGIYLYTTDLAAIENYWFDVEDKNHPEEYTPSEVTMVWGGKGVHETWFSNKPEMVHGINWLPMHGGSFYLGRYPNYVEKNYEALVRENGGENWDAWTDLIWMYRALSNPKDAIKQAKRLDNTIFEEGNSKAQTYVWLQLFNDLGPVDRSISANYPLYGVFRKKSTRTYILYNAKKTPLVVRFSDGFKMKASAKGFFSFQRELDQ